MWGYYWGYTSAQVELMIVDAPLVVYKNDKRDANGKRKAPKPTGAAIERAALKWQQEHKEDGGKITVDLSDFKIG